jgi:hypothetical protein
MSLPSTTYAAAIPIDRFTQTLKICSAQNEEPQEELEGARLPSLKMDLRAIQEVEAMEGYASDADFDDLLFVPKVQTFLAEAQHEQQESTAFWLMARIRYLALLNRTQRAAVIQLNHQIAYKPAVVMGELFKLPAVADRIRLLSRLPYRDFTVLMAEIEKRNLPLKADGGLFLSSIAFSKQNSEVRQSVRRTFLAR